MTAMPRPRKPYVQREVTRHGRTVWYFRRGTGPRYRLRGDYESPEWLEDYNSALAGVPPAERPRASSGTLGWLIDRYFDSLAFNGLAEGTKKQRRSILTRVKDKAGHWTLSQITEKKMAESIDARSSTPTAAANFVKAMKHLFKWAQKAKHMTANPAKEFSSRSPEGDGWHTWTEEEVQAYWKRHPIGTMARLALDIMLFTGMRVSDAVSFGRQHVSKDGWVHYRSKKTRVEVDLPLLDPLERSIKATAAPTALTFLLTEFGRPFSSPNSLGNRVKRWCRQAGIPHCSSHGLRKAGATIAGEAGASDLQLMAYWGWTNPKQAATYTKKANRKRLAGDAAKYLVLDEEGTSIPLPRDPVRGRA